MLETGKNEPNLDVAGPLGCRLSCLGGAQPVIPPGKPRKKDPKILHNEAKKSFRINALSQKGPKTNPD